MSTIAVLNQKGGVGKTTCTVNIAAGLRRMGRRVLMVDLDAQAHLSASLGLAPDDGPTAHEVLLGRAELATAIRRAGDAEVVPGSLRLAGAELELAHEPRRETLLRRALEPAQGYDYILLDCPPSLGLVGLGALAAAWRVIVPLQAEYLALESLGKLVETIAAVKARYNPGLELGGIVINRFAARRRLSAEVAAKLADYFGELVFATRIRENISLAEAPSFGRDIFSYRPKSNGARDFGALCREIDERMGP